MTITSVINNIQRLTYHLSTTKKNVWQIFKIIIKDNIPHTPSKVGVLERIIFSHTPGEAMSVGLAKACVPRNIDSVQEKLSSLLEKAYTGKRNNVMTQALQAEDGFLPSGLTMHNVYTELRKGSKNVVVVVKNSMAYPQTLKETLVARAVTATMVPELPAETGLLEGLDESHSPQTPKLTVRQRQGKLFE